MCSFHKLPPASSRTYPSQCAISRPISLLPFTQSPLQVIRSIPFPTSPTIFLYIKQILKPIPTHLATLSAVPRPFAELGCRCWLWLAQMMFLIPLPFVLLSILFVQALTLEGSGQGIRAYAQPEFADLADPAIWITATAQIFFSLSLGVGAMVCRALLTQLPPITHPYAIAMHIPASPHFIYPFIPAPPSISAPRTVSFPCAHSCMAWLAWNLLLGLR